MWTCLSPIWCGQILSKSRGNRSDNAIGNGTIAKGSSRRIAAKHVALRVHIFQTDIQPPILHFAVMKRCKWAPNQVGDDLLHVAI